MTMTMTIHKPRAAALTERQLKVKAIEVELHKELTPYWTLNLITNRIEVVNFAIGFYGFVDEIIMDAITNLAGKDLISF